MMKRLLIILAATAALTAGAQRSDSLTLSLTPHVGFCTSTMIAGSGENLRTTIPFTAGLDLDWHITRQWSTGLGLHYQRHGGKDQNDGWLRTENLSVNCCAGFTVAGIVILDAGLQLNVPVSSTYRNRGWEEYYDGKDISRHTHAVNLSIPVGVSVEYKRVVFRVRLGFGVTDIFDRNEIGKFRVRQGSLTIGYRIPLR